MAAAATEISVDAVKAAVLSEPDGVFTIKDKNSIFSMEVVSLRSRLASAAHSG